MRSAELRARAGDLDGASGDGEIAHGASVCGIAASAGGRVWCQRGGFFAGVFVGGADGMRVVPDEIWRDHGAQSVWHNAGTVLRANVEPAGSAFPCACTAAAGGTAVCL